MKYQVRRFSFFGNLTGNPELTSKFFGGWAKIKTTPEVEEDLKEYRIKPDSDFGKIMSILYIHNPGTSKARISGPLKNSNFFVRGYKDLLMNLEDPDHTSSGIMKYPEHRVVIGMIASDIDCIIVSWLPRKNKFLVTKEKLSYNLISRGVGKLFGEKKFEVLLETTDFKKVLEYLKGVSMIYF